MTARGTSKKDALAARMRAVTNASTTNEEVRNSATEEMRNSANEDAPNDATTPTSPHVDKQESPPADQSRIRTRRAKPVNQPSAAAPAPRTTPVRITVAMPPVDHRRLKAWCATTAAELELPIVAGAEVLRVLWSMTQTDPDLANRLKEKLARTGGSQRQ